MKSEYLFSVMPSIAGCPGLVPGWRAVSNYDMRLAPHSPRPSLLAPVPAHRDWGEKGRAGVGRGTRWVAGNVRHPGTRPGQHQIALTTHKSDRKLR